MLVEVHDLTKTHQSPGGGAPVEILKGLEFELEAGSTAAILGPSGAGKSTLLNILGSLDRADSGVVRVGGLDPAVLKGKELVEFRRRTVGMIFQMHHLLPQCTVLENVLAPTLVDRKQARLNAEVLGKDLLDWLGLAHRLDHRPGELSGGERQRVAVARALCGSPRLLLADEPTGALDRANAAQLSGLLLELNRARKVALLVVTHSRELAGQMEQVWELRDGKLVKAA